MTVWENSLKLVFSAQGFGLIFVNTSSSSADILRNSPDWCLPTRCLKKKIGPKFCYNNDKVEKKLKKNFFFVDSYIFYVLWLRKNKKEIVLLFYLHLHEFRTKKDRQNQVLSSSFFFFAMQHQVKNYY